MASVSRRPRKRPNLRLTSFGTSHDGDVAMLSTEAAGSRKEGSTTTCVPAPSPRGGSPPLAKEATVTPVASTPTAAASKSVASAAAAAAAAAPVVPVTPKGSEPAAPFIAATKTTPAPAADVPRLASEAEAAESLSQLFFCNKATTPSLEATKAASAACASPPTRPATPPGSPSAAGSSSSSSSSSTLARCKRSRVDFEAAPSTPPAATRRPVAVPPHPAAATARRRLFTVLPPLQHDVTAHSDASSDTSSPSQPSDMGAAVVVAANTTRGRVASFASEGNSDGEEEEEEQEEQAAHQARAKATQVARRAPKRRSQPRHKALSAIFEYVRSQARKSVPSPSCGRDSPATPGAGITQGADRYADIPSSRDGSKTLHALYEWCKSPARQAARERAQATIARRRLNRWAISGLSPFAARAARFLPAPYTSRIDDDEDSASAAGASPSPTRAATNAAIPLLSHMSLERRLQVLRACASTPPVQSLPLSFSPADLKAAGSFMTPFKHARGGATATPPAMPNTPSALQGQLNLKLHQRHQGRSIAVPAASRRGTTSAASCVGASTSVTTSSPLGFASIAPSLFRTASQAASAPTTSA